MPGEDYQPDAILANAFLLHAIGQLVQLVCDLQKPVSCFFGTHDLGACPQKPCTLAVLLSGRGIRFSLAHSALTIG
jgi:hypothetical protein